VPQPAGDDGVVVPLAPRYSHRIFDAVRALDDPSEPMAETCRRVGVAAERMGLPRPSYSHLRRYIREERERRAAIRAVLSDAATDLIAGKVPQPYYVLQRLERAAG
jgi:hypothetical protein